MSSTIDIQLVVVGPQTVGKTALVLQYILHNFQPEYDPTIEDAFRKQIIIDGKICSLEIVDSAGQLQSDCFPSQIIDQILKTGDGYLLVFDTNNLESLDNMLEYVNRIRSVKNGLASSRSRAKVNVWDDLYSLGLPSYPMVMAGNKYDLMSSSTLNPQLGNPPIQDKVVTRSVVSRARQEALKLGAPLFFTSAKTRANVDKAFNCLVRQAIRKKLTER